MPRFYVEHNGEWNIFSTVVDDFLFDEFVCLDALKARLLYERFKELTEDMDSLLTDNPRVNVMAYREAIERKQVDTPQTEICDTCKYRSSNAFGNWCVGRDTCDRYEADTPQTDCETCKYGEDKHRYAHICNECGVGINNYTPQTESTGSPIGDYRDGVGAWDTDCGWK